MPPTLCLNMIVKNESKIIERLLETVVPIIDAYCICDTGSTDDTKDRITRFMESRKIPGEVFEEPFKNFGYNRDMALKRADKWADYALLLDADMKLVIGPDFRKDAFTKDGYMCIQGNDRFEYYNTRIVRTKRGVRCVCPTHEYYDFPGGLDHNHKLAKSFLRIDDIGDGGCKSDKFERDIRLLKGGLETDPNNGRYHFYIANSYRDLGKKQEAIEWYEKRIKIGGWVEEIWNSWFEMGKCYFALGNAAKAIESQLMAYNARTQRAESLYEIAKYYRETGKHQVGMMFVEKARTIPFPKDDVLFIHKDVYEYLLEYEYSILAYYTHSPIHHKRYLELLGSGHYRDNVITNYQFYCQSLHSMCGGALVKKRVDFSDRCEKIVRAKVDAFKSSSPCIIPHGEGYLMNIRYVNYNLDKGNGSYSFKHDDGKIITLNKCVLLDRHFAKRKEFWLDRVHREDTRYLGLEDVKVFAHENELRFLGTTQDEQGRPRIGEGVYNYKSDILFPTVYPSPSNTSCEKNWVHFHHRGELKTVYNWSPFLYGCLDGKKFDPETAIHEVPAFFRDLRGSTNGCVVPSKDGDELWFLCHYVGYSTPRHYYHCFVVLDAETLRIKRHSILFKLEGEKIEYALGLIVEPDRVLISYSKWDAESIVSVYDRPALEAAVF